MCTLSGFGPLTHTILSPNATINMQMWSASWCNMTMYFLLSMSQKVKWFSPCRSWAVFCSQTRCLVCGVSCGRAQSSRLPTVQPRHRKQPLWGHGWQLQQLAGCGQHSSISAICSTQVINVYTYTWHAQFVLVLSCTRSEVFTHLHCYEGYKCGSSQQFGGVAHMVER